MNMKRLFALVLALSGAATLVSCGKQETPTPEPPPVESSVSVIAPVEPEPVYQFFNPLTGEGCARDISRNRPVAIMLNNHKKAMPQLGVSQADIIYELPAEGGITRMMGLFQSTDGVGSIGTVRSARDYYVSLAFGHDAIFLHAGGSPMAYDAIQSWGVDALDCVNGPYEGTLFWRDSWRKKNRGLEHSVLTSGDTISSLLPTYKRLRLEHPEDFSDALLFDRDQAQGDPASVLTVVFSNYKTGSFTYDPDTGLYKVSQYGGPYVDGNTDQQVAVRNVLVLRTDVGSVKGDDKGRKTLRTTGEGSGILLRDGVAQEITWHKRKNSTPMYYTDKDGSPVSFGVGHSYINMLDESCKVTLQP